MRGVEKRDRYANIQDKAALSLSPSEYCIMLSETYTMKSNLQYLKQDITYVAVIGIFLYWMNIASG